MDSKEDGLRPAVRPVLPPGRTDWTVRNTGDLFWNQNRQVDSQIHLNRIGRTGIFGCVGVSISVVCNKQSWTEMNEISNYFGVKMTRAPSNDIDVCFL